LLCARAGEQAGHPAGGEPTGQHGQPHSVEIMQIFRGLNDAGLTIVLSGRTKRTWRSLRNASGVPDGKIRHDDPVEERREREVLKSMRQWTSRAKRMGIV